MSNRVVLISLLTCAMALGCSDATEPTPVLPPPPAPPVVEPPVVQQVEEDPFKLQWDASLSIDFTTVGAVTSSGAGLRSSLLPPQTREFYLVGNGVPQASLDSIAPTLATLPNYDANRDSDRGLMIKKDGGSLKSQTDDEKYQQWAADVGPIDINGPVSLTLWSAMKDFKSDKRGKVKAGLFECARDGSDCQSIVEANRNIKKWSGGSNTWVERTIDFGDVVYSVPAGRMLAIKIIVSNSSDDDMWFAYGTSSYPSRLSVGYNTSSGNTANFEASFWAVRGQARSLEINYTAAGPDTVQYPFVRLDVPEPITYTDGSPIAVGDSVLITVGIDPVDFVVYLEPSGLQFAAGSTVLQMWYAGAGGDLNGDGVVDAQDAQAEAELLDLWYQATEGDPWTTIPATQSTSAKSFEAYLDHFSNYSLAW